MGTWFHLTGQSLQLGLSDDKPETGPGQPSGAQTGDAPVSVVYSQTAFQLATSK